MKGIFIIYKIEYNINKNISIGVSNIMNKFMSFFSDNKDFFASIGIFLTFLMSACSLYFSIKNNKAVHYVNAITKSRIEWVQKLRSTVAEFIANTNIYNNAYYRGDYQKTGIHLSKCQQLCTEIKLLLNCCDVRDKEISDIVDEILENYSNYCNNLHNCNINSSGYFEETRAMSESKRAVIRGIELLSKKIQIYLKAEWNRIKYESQGKIYQSETQEFDYRELENKFDDIGYKNQKWKRWCINLSACLKRKIEEPQLYIIILIAICILIVLG